MRTPRLRPNELKAACLIIRSCRFFLWGKAFKTLAACHRGLGARARFSEPISDLNAEMLKAHIVCGNAQDSQLI